MEGKNKTVAQFDEWAETYEEGFWSYYFSFANKKILGLLKKRLGPNSDILDVGCGPGILINYLADYFNGEIIGVDISPEMIKLAKDRNREFKNVRFENVEIENAKLKNKFDAIVCMNSFHHYNEHTNILKAFKGLLKKDGIIILLDPHRDNPLRKLWTYILKNIFDEKDVAYFTKRQLMAMATDSGLTLIRQDSFLYFTLISEFKRV